MTTQRNARPGWQTGRALNGKVGGIGDYTGTLRRLLTIEAADHLQRRLGERLDDGEIDALTRAVLIDIRWWLWTASFYEVLPHAAVTVAGVDHG